MDYYQALDKWEKYIEVLSEVKREVRNILHPVSYYDEKYQYRDRKYEADEDTVFLIKFSEQLKDICDFVQAHIAVLEHRIRIEEEIRINLEQSYEAWKRNLCPLLMKNIQRTLRPPDYNIWETYDEVAEFLADGVMSYRSTYEAIECWLSSRQMKKSA